MKKRILFVMSDTGGGHRASARAIEEAIHALYPGQYETIIQDIWQGYMPWPINRIPQAYPWLTGPGLAFWKFLWTFSIWFRPHRLAIPLLSPLLETQVVRYFQQLQPDLILSVHPFMNHLVLKWLKKSGLAVPLVTTVTDMVTIHPLWICPGVSRCLVPTEAARRAAIELGMPAEKISVCGQPISLKFNRRMEDKQSLRRKLGLAPERPTVLVMGGGEGFGRVFEVSRSLAQALPQAQLLVVAGRNAALKAQLESVSWEIPTRIYGFVDHIPELMGAADLLVTKAGPGTISEAFSVGLPVLLYGYIPGQEEGNISYVETHRAGAYAEAPETLAGLATGWFSPGNPTLAEMAGQAARLAHPQAALSIATHACELLKEQPAQPEPLPLRSTWRDSRATRLALRVLRL